MLQILNDHLGHSRLRFQWDHSCEHLRIVMGRKKEPAYAWDFYQVLPGIQLMTEVFARPKEPACVFSIYEVSKKGEETLACPPQWIAFEEENRVRVIKKEAVLDGLAGTLVTVSAQRRLQENCIFYTVQPMPGCEYPIPVLNRELFRFFVAAVQPQELELLVREERPDILLQQS